MSNVVRIRTFTAGWAATILAVASTPSTPGIFRSMRITSGFNAADLATASSPSTA